MVLAQKNTMLPRDISWNLLVESQGQGFLKNEGRGQSFEPNVWANTGSDVIPIPTMTSSVPTIVCPDV